MKAVGIILGVLLIMGGVTRIVGSFGLRDLYKRGGRVGGNWGLVLAVGILVTLGGVFCLFHPVLTMASAGMLIGMGVISSGVSLVVGSLAE